MCGRYTLITLADLVNCFPWITTLPERIAPRYNIAPTQPILIIPNDNRSKFDHALWGLIPSWAKDPSIGSRMINARAETLDEKPTFRNALRRRRCLIPADGFYEWRKNRDGSKTPMRIRRRDGRPFAFAGLWEIWGDDKGNEVRSATIITTAPNELVRPIHDRMPAILRPEFYDKWLSPDEVPPAEAKEMLKPFPANQLAAEAVSGRVNSPKAEGPDCIAPAVEDDEASLF